MNYLQKIRQYHNNPEQLEIIFQSAVQRKEIVAFKTDFLACREEASDNILYTAWYYRLQSEEREKTTNGSHPRNWKAAIPLTVLSGLLFWGLSDEHLSFLDRLPYFVLFWAPVASLAALVFLNLTAGKNHRRSRLVGIGLIVACLYVFLIAPGQAPKFQRDYLTLMAIHLPLLCWAGLGASLLDWGSKPAERFAFLMKSIEVMITAGLYLLAGMAFAGITMGMFAALNVTLPEVLVRLIAAGGFGLIPVIAVASVYDPRLPPASQDFDQGLSKLIATLMRLLLPLTLAVLLIYLFVIPFNFMEPFKEREVLIVYNVMLFAILGLLVGVTPVTPDDLSEKLQKALRIGILVVAILAVLVSLYALSATAYRTAQGGITINRLTILGWNSINIGLLILIIYNTLKNKGENWVPRLKGVFGIGSLAYPAWTLFLILAIPLLFR